MWLPFTRVLNSRRFFYCLRTAAGQSLTTSRYHADVIRPEEIEWDAVGDIASTAASTSTNYLNERSGDPEVVSTLDLFSKSKVMNFLKRVRKPEKEKFDGDVEQMGQFEHQKVWMDSNSHLDSSPVHRCLLKFVLPHPHASQTAEGIAPTEREAELAATMHAERIIDSLGLHLFSLPSMQSKHAEAAKNAGRWAPTFSGERGADGFRRPRPIRFLPTEISPLENNERTNVDTNVPPVEDQQCAEKRMPISLGKLQSPRQLLCTDPYLVRRDTPPMYDVTEAGSFDMVITQSLRSPTSAFACHLSYVLDKAALPRIDQFFSAFSMKLTDHVTYKHAAVVGASHRMHLAEISLDSFIARGAHRNNNITSDFGSVVAKGKAMEAPLALQLAAMHAEMLIDFYGLRLFPNDRAKQRQHSIAAIGVGRWAIGGSEGQAGDDRPITATMAPLPLKQLTGVQVAEDDAGTAAVRSSRSLHERIVAMHVNLTVGCQSLLEVHPPPGMMMAAPSVLRRYISQCTGSFYPELFVVGKIGEFWRAATVLPFHLHTSVAGQDSTGSITDESTNETQIRGGLGTGRTVLQACQLAALNALDNLALMNIDVWSVRDMEKGSDAVTSRGHVLATGDVVAQRLENVAAINPAVNRRDYYACRMSMNLPVPTTAQAEDTNSAMLPCEMVVHLAEQLGVGSLISQLHRRTTVDVGQPDASGFVLPSLPLYQIEGLEPNLVSPR